MAVTTFGARGPVPPAPVVLHRWHEFHAASVREHTPLVVLTPLAPDRRPDGLPHQLAVVTWDRTTRVQQMLNTIRAASPDKPSQMGPA